MCPGFDCPTSLAGSVLVNILYSPLETELTHLSKGLYLADASLFIACAMTLSVFNISKVIEDGREIEPEVKYTSGTIRCA